MAAKGEVMTMQKSALEKKNNALARQKRSASIAVMRREKLAAIILREVIGMCIASNQIN